MASSCSSRCRSSPARAGPVALLGGRRRRRAAQRPAGARPRADARRGALIALAIAACGVLRRSCWRVLGADYLAPRNLVGGDDPAERADRDPARGGDSTARGCRLGVRSLGALGVLAAFLAITVDVDLSPRLQRGNWRDVAARSARAVARAGDHDRRARRRAARVLPAAAPAQPRAPRRRVRVSEIDETGYAPLRTGAGRPPAPGFQPARRRETSTG